MGNDDISLDPEAQSLFEQFGGMESWKSQLPGGPGSDRMAQSLLAEQQRLDTVRILLIRMAYLVSRYLGNEGFAGKEASESGVFKNLSTVLLKLSGISGHLGGAFIRYRGTSSDQEVPQRYDYEVIIGNTGVDNLMAPRVARRSGEQAVKLPGQLLEAFTVFADYGVNNIFIRIPDNLQSHLSPLQLSLKILSGFRKSRQTGTPILITSDERQQQVPLINDENMFPDPNLTTIAGLNGVSSKAMEKLVEKVDLWLRKQDRSPQGKAADIKKYAGIYNAAIEFPKIRAQLKRPIIELNNVKWLISETDEDAVSLEKVFIAQLAMETAGATPQKVAKIIKSVYGDDYAKIDTTLLGERLHLSSDLLAAAETRPEEAKYTKEVLGNLQIRLDQVKDHVIDEVQVRIDTGEERKAGKQVPPDAVDKKIFSLVSFYKGRSNTRKKMVGMVHRTVDFQPRDFKILAKDFRIPIDDAKALVQKLKACFEENGRFKKNAFTAAIDHFRQYEQKIFAFLWHHMKDAILPEDRVAFLNSLQALTAQMNQPKRALKVLLEDICSDPDDVQFSDNKAVMLINLIVHRPDKSLADYEITPEDIVLSRTNLDEMVVQYAAWRIDKERDQFFAKVQTIHTKLAEALNLGQTRNKKIPASVLLNLEREMFIFLSLVECDTGKAILRSASYEYGDPQAELYHHQESEKFMGALLQNLRVVLRGVGTIGTMGDAPALEAIKKYEEDFQRLKKDPHYRAQARMITEWVEEAVKIIKFRA